MSGQVAGLVRAFERGWRAAQAGGRREDCPYLVAANRDAWAQGFEAARLKSSRRDAA